MYNIRKLILWVEEYPGNVLSKHCKLLTTSILYTVFYNLFVF